MKFQDGSVVNGEWINGKLCGYGEMTYANGDEYKGEW